MRWRLQGGRVRAAAFAVARLACAGLLLSGCGLLGKPQPLSADAPLDMSLTGPDFVQDVIPARFTCHADGLSQSPPLSWSGTPQGTKSLAVVVDDSAAPISPRIYWMVFDIGPGTTDLQTNALPPGARQAHNSANKADYDPPCPQGAPHKYRFTVYALNTFFKSLPNGAQLLPAWTAIAKHVIARGTFTATALP